MTCLFVNVSTQIYYTPSLSRDKVTSYDYELPITELVLYFMSLWYAEDSRRFLISVELVYACNLPIHTEKSLDVTSI